MVLMIRQPRDSAGKLYKSGCWSRQSVHYHPPKPTRSHPYSKSRHECKHEHEHEHERTRPPPDRVRVAGLVVPKPGMSLEEFHDYWLNTHAKLFSSIAIAKRNLTKYEQFHLDAKSAAALGAVIPGCTTPPYAGIGILEAESLDKIFEIFQDEEYLRVVAPDEERFIARKDMQILAGSYVTVFGA
ncbi:hypothetical protein C8Q80DRAFT_1355588 [Daedaleopsis nitida]|nr:hypothetical protein C8Q80DRAFT_1355588 [Daedaleopsis nitida]